VPTSLKSKVVREDASAVRHGGVIFPIYFLSFKRQICIATVECGEVEMEIRDSLFFCFCRLIFTEAAAEPLAPIAQQTSTAAMNSQPHRHRFDRTKIGIIEISNVVFGN
jgi:hypothetical protein